MQQRAAHGQEGAAERGVEAEHGGAVPGWGGGGGDEGSGGSEGGGEEGWLSGAWAR